MTSVQFGLATIDESAMVSDGMPVDSPAMAPNPINLVRSSRIPADSTNGRWVNGFAYTWRCSAAIPLFPIGSRIC
jgi:hypothetical protein